MASRRYAIQEFTEDVYDYLWKKQIFHSPRFGQEYTEDSWNRGPEGTRSSNFSKEIGRAVRVSGLFLRDYFNHFLKFTLDEESFKNEVEVLWSNWLENRTIIFVKVIDTLAILAEIFLYIDKYRNYSFHITDVREWFMEWFDNYLEADFFSHGGWVELEKTSRYKYKQACEHVKKHMKNTNLFKYEFIEYDCAMVRFLKASAVMFPCPERAVCNNCREPDDVNYHMRIIYLRPHEEFIKDFPETALVVAEDCSKSETTKDYDSDPKLLTTDTSAEVPVKIPELIPEQISPEDSPILQKYISDLDPEESKSKTDVIKIEPGHASENAATDKQTQAFPLKDRSFPEEKMDATEAKETIAESPSEASHKESTEETFSEKPFLEDSRDIEDTSGILPTEPLCLDDSKEIKVSSKVKAVVVLEPIEEQSEVSSSSLPIAAYKSSIEHTDSEVPGSETPEDVGIPGELPEPVPLTPDQRDIIKIVLRRGLLDDNKRLSLLSRTYYNSFDRMYKEVLRKNPNLRYEIMHYEFEQPVSDSSLEQEAAALSAIPRKVETNSFVYTSDPLKPTIAEAGVARYAHYEYRGFFFPTRQQREVHRQNRAE